MARKWSNCVSSSPNVYKAGEKTSSSDKGSKSSSGRGKEYRGKSLRNRLGIPKLRSSNLSPLRIIGRFVHALLHSGSSKNEGSSCVRNNSSTKCYPGHFSQDSLYTEAIQDCIEYMKKSSAIDERVS